VRDGRIVSESFHARFGGPHAEQSALARLNFGQSSGSVCYVNLEPCNHHGKTPPCTEAILRAGIRKVVVGVLDPNPLVNGNGVRRLREAGIDVQVGVLEEECQRINEGFFTAVRFHRSFVTLKIAQTLDGKIADLSGRSRWISGKRSRDWVHRLRRQQDAIVIGLGTLLRDDPLLTVRSSFDRRIPGNRMCRIVLDSRLRCPEKAAVFNHQDPENTIVATTSRSAAAKQKALLDKGIRVWILPADSDGRVSVRRLVEKTAAEGILSLLVEGGTGVFTSFLGGGYADRLVVFLAPLLMGNG
jgi:diaminohydroxyphosphoribosylaminopyrimidine deaminase/5-amino-6-(5-phosphoribosylamino)uracil reductase